MWKGKGMCFPGMCVCSRLCQRHGKGKVEPGQMTLETAESQVTDEMGNLNSAFASRQERRSTDGPYGQEKGKEGKGKDGHTDKGKGKVSSSERHAGARRQPRVHPRQRAGDEGRGR